MAVWWKHAEAIMNFGAKIKRLLREIRLILYYCSPCLLSLAIVVGVNFDRVRDVEKIVVRQVCQQLDRENASNEPEVVIPPQLQKIINVVKANGWRNCQQSASSVAPNMTAPQYIQSYFLRAWSANTVVIATLTVLPFGILAVGLALKFHSYGTHKPSGVANDLLLLHEKDEYLIYKPIAFKDF